jgi:hypothetical protein
MSWLSCATCSGSSARPPESRAASSTAPETCLPPDAEGTPDEVSGTASAAERADVDRGARSMNSSKASLASSATLPMKFLIVSALPMMVPSFLVVLEMMWCRRWCVWPAAAG